MDSSNKLGAYLRSAREKRSLTLRSVEEQTGISNAYLSQLENGRIAQPSPVMLHKLSGLYECSYVDVMRAAGYPMPTSTAASTGARARARFSDVTPDEEKQLAEYLDFIRSRKGPRR